MINDNKNFHDLTSTSVIFSPIESDASLLTSPIKKCLSNIQQNDQIENYWLAFLLACCGEFEEKK